MQTHQYHSHWSQMILKTINIDWNGTAATTYDFDKRVGAPTTEATETTIAI